MAGSLLSAVAEPFEPVAVFCGCDGAELVLVYVDVVVVVDMLGSVTMLFRKRSVKKEEDARR